MFGEDDFMGGRYAYLTLMFLVPSIAVALSVLVPLVTAPRVATVALSLFFLVAYAAHSSYLFHQDHDVRASLTSGWPGLMKGLRAAAQDGELVLTKEPPFDYVHVRFRADLAARKEMWDKLPQGEPSPAQRLEAENLFFTGVGTETFVVGGGEALRPVLGFTSTRPVTRGCRTVTATGSVASLALDTGPDGAQFGISGPSSTLVTHLVRDGEQSTDRTWEIEAGRGFWLATSAQDAELVVNVGAPGDYQVCKV
jgi:hypothetical protein